MAKIKKIFKKIRLLINVGGEGSSVRRAENLVGALPETRNFAVALLHSPAGIEYLLVWVGDFLTFQPSSVEFNLQGKKNFPCKIHLQVNLKLLGLELSLQNSQARTKHVAFIHVPDHQEP